MSHCTHLECSSCGKHHDHTQPQTVCRSCGKPLLARYDVDAINDAAAGFQGRTMWRYAPLLPVDDPAHAITLGEGGTPLLQANDLGAELGLDGLYVKDEGVNPTGTFKSRGMSMAVTRALELGAEHLAVPSAGNAAGALAAYGARAGVPVTVAMPADTPQVNQDECRSYGAHVELVDGLITDCGAWIAERAAEHGWTNVATFNEPYRVEGKKTMGLELWEDLGAVPDVVVYPTGGGTGLVGIVKALDELEALGRIGSERPRMIAVQSTGCAPVVDAIERGVDELDPWQDAATDAAGLRVPKALAGHLIVHAIRRTGGTAIAVDDSDMRAARDELAASEGISVGLEAAATLAGLHRLVDDGAVDRDESVVLLATGAAWKSRA